MMRRPTRSTRSGDEHAQCHAYPKAVAFEQSSSPRRGLTRSRPLLRKLPRLKVRLLGCTAHDLVEPLRIEVGGRIARDVKQGVVFWHLAEKLGAAS